MERELFLEEAIKALKQEESKGRRYRLVNRDRERLLELLEELRERRLVAREIEDRDRRFQDIRDFIREVERELELEDDEVRVHPLVEINGLGNGKSAKDVAWVLKA